MKYAVIFVMCTFFQACMSLSGDDKSVVLVDVKDTVIPAFIQKCQPVSKYTVKVSGTANPQDRHIQDDFKNDVASERPGNFILYKKDGNKFQKVHQGLVFHCPKKYLRPYLHAQLTEL